MNKPNISRFEVKQGWSTCCNFVAIVQSWVRPLLSMRKGFMYNQVDLAKLLNMCSFVFRYLSESNSNCIWMFSDRMILLTTLIYIKWFSCSVHLIESTSSFQKPNNYPKESLFDHSKKSYSILSLNVISNNPSLSPSFEIITIVM